MTSTLAAACAGLIGAAVVIAVFLPRTGAPEPPRTQPFSAARQGPGEAPQPSDKTVAVRGDVDATRLDDVASVKLVTPEERPIGRNADASPATLPPAPAAPSVPRAATPINSVAAAGMEAASPGASQSADMARPTGAAPSPPAAREGDAAPHDAQEPLAAPNRIAPTAWSKANAAQPTAPRLDSRAKLLRRPSTLPPDTKIAVAPSDAAAATLRETHPSAAPSATAAPEAIASPSEPGNFVTHAFGALANAIETPAGDPSVSRSGNWAIQFAAPKTEAEAADAAARLNAKYAGALNGATIAVQKSQVNGSATAYALRVAGLSKAEAQALCLRVRGRDCSMPESAAPTSQAAAPIAQARLRY